MTLHFSSVFHTGYIVEDLVEGMDELGTLLRVRWAKAVERRVDVRTSDGVRPVALRFTYTADDSSTRVELIERIEGTLWDLSTGPGRLHHLGFWAEDLQGESDRLASLGAPLVLTRDTGDGGVFAFAYHRAPSGALIELVDATMRDAFERWFAGGELPDPAARGPRSAR
jgi:catechol 2,3-dioxygenase-like lactoylglutathione lyase family enzyme